MDRASVVFEERGFVAATMNHLVAATGLTRGAFYFHFESKEAVAVAIVQAQAERWQPLVAEIEKAETEPLRRLLRLAFKAAEAVQADPLIRAAHRLMAERAAVLGEVPGTFTWWVNTLRGYLEDAHRRGQLPDLTRLVREGSSADPLTALAEYVVARWAGVQQAALASGRNDLTDRVVTSWVILLPWLSSSPAAGDELFEYIRELSSGPVSGEGRPPPE
jgi:AcrR family transcriptional regulator